jgi:hypothetical protein
MRLYEIIGNSEEEIFTKLRSIYFILHACSTVSPCPPSLSSLRNIEIARLNEDSENLLVWTLKSDRIHKIYNEIKQYI